MWMKAYTYLQPEIFVATMACFILIIDIFLKPSMRWITYLLTLVTLAGAAYFSMQLYAYENTTLFQAAFVHDKVSCTLKLFIYLITAILLIYSKQYLTARLLDKGEFFVLVLFSMLGMMILVSSGQFLSLYLGLELLSLPLYALVAMDRKQILASEAAMKYFVMGGMASGLLLYGISILYGVTGSIVFSNVAEYLIAQPQMPMSIQCALVFILAGLAFKIGAVPFHMWIPDVYQGAPITMTLLIGTTPKIAAFGMAFRLLADAMPSLQADWQLVLMLMAILSLAVGNVIAIAQTNIKRMLAYSTIGHMGFVLIGLVSGPEAGYAAAMHYTLIYGLMALGAFGMIIFLSQSDVEADKISDFRGFGKTHPWLAFIMLILMFSMAGVPPTAGFYAKFFVLQAAVESGYLMLAVIALIFSVIGAFYYLRVIRRMYFETPDPKLLVPCAGMSYPGMALLSLNGLGILLLGIFPAPVIYLCLSALQ